MAVFWGSVGSLVKYSWRKRSLIVVAMMDTGEICRGATIIGVLVLRRGE